MEEQLAAYRARKARESGQSRNLLGSLRGAGGLFCRNRGRTTGEGLKNTATLKPTDTDATTNNDKSESVPENDDLVDVTKNEERRERDRPTGPPIPAADSFLGRVIQPNNLVHLSLKLVLWLALFGLFVCLGFGAIFIIASLFYVIYANMRGEGEKKPGERSAYSVFNPNCERIHGTLTAEEIERGMLYGVGGAMR